MKSWRTTVAAVAGILIFVASKYFGILPEDVQNEGEAIGIIVGIAGSFFARDNKVSSEEAGAK